MTTMTTAGMLANAIEASPLTQREIAHRAGFNHVNVLSMMKAGLTKVPLPRVPTLAKVLEMDEQAFLLHAIREYEPETYDVLIASFGLALSEDERALISQLRAAGEGDTAAFELAFRAFLEQFQQAGE